jgi:5-aminolevulinate synthase
LAYVRFTLGSDRTADIARGPVRANTGSRRSVLSLVIGDAHLCRRTSELLLEDHYICIQPINYPTVARGQERLRITPTPYHTETHMRRLVDALVAVRARLGWSAPRVAA